MILHRDVSANKISIIWPYWDRQTIADRSYSLLDKHYSHLSVEIIVADDGNIEPYKIPAGNIPIKVIRLPRKSIPKNPSVPINCAVAASSGDTIVLTNPEVLHHEPILEQMVGALQHEDDYIQAAVIFNEGPRPQWHSHSVLAGKIEEGIKLPDGACFHHLAMMTYKLWIKAGGMDEKYRDGYCFEDTDFVMRLGAAGARFIMRDDLVAEHVQSCANSKWYPGWRRLSPIWHKNRDIFVKRWST